MRKKPVIAICSSMSDNFIRMNKAYFEAVYRSGGIPVFLHFAGGEAEAEQFFADEFDGFLFAGGVDIDPKYYGEEIAGENVEICRERDVFELRLLELLKNDKRPVLGICRGEQVINVFYGGTLFQHMEGHRQTEPGTEMPYRADIVRGTLLHELAGCDECATNSFHHQAVKAVAPSLVACAVDKDGAIEAVEGRDRERFLLCLQWHPELCFERSELSRNVFAKFVGAAREHAER